jgi:glycosyltransferase involved in cell wall biosynthesis
MFDLARQMKALGEEVHLFTALPGFKVDSDMRDVAHTRSARLLAWRGLDRLPLGNRTNVLENATFRDFGRWLGREAERTNLDVLDALDGVGLEGGRRVRQNGGVWVCNRGSAHILTQRDLVTEEHRRWNVPMPRTYFHPWMVDRCLAEYAGANAIAVPSTFARRSFLDRGFAPESVHLSPYGVDLSMFQPQPKADTRFRLLFVGTQSIRKGVGYLFDAVRPLVSSGQVELWLIGTAGDAKAILDRNAGLFTHQGVQPRGRLAHFYSQGSVLVLPSVEEGLALVQAQALACGLPVISTYNAGAEDLFTDSVEGFIVPPRDPAAIRERIQLLLDDPARLERMRVAALRRVRSLGGWSAYGERCHSIYRRLRGLTPEPACQ